MHRSYLGRIPVDFDQLFTSVNQAHFCKSGPLPCNPCYHKRWIHLATGYESQRHNISKTHWPKIWDSTDPSLYDISLSAFKRQLKDRLVNEYTVVID